ncbi:MAG: sugar phosphate isomerase/epimerase [Chloroflexi bacterium]|nr:MAG: sugar phosphate isomerase/epimerase [Chloroflexota bacterium]
MIRLSAFADEISPDLEEQIVVLSSEKVRFLDLRGVWNTNVLDLSDQQVTRVKETLDAHGIGVAAIGSPIGKVPIDSSFNEHLHLFERAITVAQALQTPYIRIFSFYPPAASDRGAINPAEYRDEVLRRLREMTARARAAAVILLHENEKDIYGDTIARCVDLLQGINDAHFQAVFDPANFIQCGQTPYPDAYEAIRPWLRYVHVKDARSDGSVVPAGEGVSHWPELLQRLRADGYDGFLSLEPHLALAGQYQGFSGPDLFRRASQALQQMLQAMGWEYA